MSEALSNAYMNAVLRLSTYWEAQNEKLGAVSEVWSTVCGLQITHLDSGIQSTSYQQRLATLRRQLKASPWIAEYLSDPILELVNETGHECPAEGTTDAG